MIVGVSFLLEFYLWTEINLKTSQFVVFLDFSSYIIKLSIYTAIGAEFKTMYSTKDELIHASGMWLSVCSQLHLRWPFFPGAPFKVSLCKASSWLKVHMTFFSQRFSSLCSCKVVGYCSMKLNNNCNCTFFPEDLKYWRYYFNAFI